MLKKKKQKDSQSKTYVVVCCLILAATTLGICYLMLNPNSKSGSVGFSVDKEHFEFSASTKEGTNAHNPIENKKTPNPSN
jgi:hypothetical protein